MTREMDYVDGNPDTLVVVDRLPVTSRLVADMHDLSETIHRLMATPTADFVGAEPEDQFQRRSTLSRMLGTVHHAMMNAANIEAVYPSHAAPPSDDAYLHWLWTQVRPVTKYVSCALPEGARYHPDVDLSANGASQPDPVSNLPMRMDHTTLPKSGLTGLPKDWTWLVTSWRLELRDTDGWNCAGLRGSMSFRYDDNRIAQRPLTDALVPRDDDLLLVMREGVAYSFDARFDRGVERIGAGSDRAPRLYVFMDVIAKQSVV
jgi:hypothetical protein